MLCYQMPDWFHQEDLIVSFVELPGQLILGYKIVCMKISLKFIEDNMIGVTLASFLILGCIEVDKIFAICLQGEVICQVPCICSLFHWNTRVVCFIAKIH